MGAEIAQAKDQAREEGYKCISAPVQLFRLTV